MLQQLQLFNDAAVAAISVAAVAFVNDDEVANVVVVAIISLVALVNDDAVAAVANVNNAQVVVINVAAVAVVNVAAVAVVNVAAVAVVSLPLAQLSGMDPGVGCQRIKVKPPIYLWSKYKCFLMRSYLDMKILKQKSPHFEDCTRF